MKRTHLPLNGLRVLDAAARHLSFTRAADELAVTPAAVGQQIRALEDMLGVVLFRRTPKGLELTDEAVAGLDALRGGFLQFEEAVRAMQSGQSSHVYTIAAPRDVLGLWLAPRLAAFRAENPQLRYVLVGGDAETDFTEANLDLAVRFGEGPGDLEGVALGEGGRVTVAAPGSRTGCAVDRLAGRRWWDFGGRGRTVADRRRCGTGDRLGRRRAGPGAGAGAARATRAGRRAGGRARRTRTVPPRLLAGRANPAVAPEEGQGAGRVSDRGLAARHQRSIPPRRRGVDADHPLGREARDVVRPARLLETAMLNIAVAVATSKELPLAVSQGFACAAGRSILITG